MGPGLRRDDIVGEMGIGTNFGRAGPVRVPDLLRLRRDDTVVGAWFSRHMGKLFIVYIMANRKNGTLYIGVSGNPIGRIWQHKNDWFEGFTKQYGVKRLVWYEVYENAEAAIIREKRIKEWQRAWKVRLIEERNPDWRDLYKELTGEE